MKGWLEQNPESELVCGPDSPASPLCVFPVPTLAEASPSQGSTSLSLWPRPSSGSCSAPPHCLHLLSVLPLLSSDSQSSKAERLSAVGRTEQTLRSWESEAHTNQIRCFCRSEHSTQKWLTVQQRLEIDKSVWLHRTDPF